MKRMKEFIKPTNIIAFIFIILMISFLFLQAYQTGIETIAKEAPQIRQASSPQIASVPVAASYQALQPKTVRVILERIYLDGEISEEIVEETILSMEDFWAEYSDWNLVDQDDVQIVFQQKVDDISPLLKINGYFGISEEGILNIYDGKPSEEKIIQSFFQINTKQLKSHQQKELQKGIPVLSRDRYEEVIKIYKRYVKTEM